jgi:uncharacterized repeat protein (TIGR03803 family)
MKHTPQHRNWISRIRLRAASAALALAAVLAPAVIATQSARAQTFNVLHSFDTADGPKAAQAGLIQGTNGDFYGTTQFGGLYSNGSVFKMTPSGTLATISSFCPPPEDGCENAGTPGALVLGTNGKIYGTTGVGPLGTTGTAFVTTPSSGVTAPIATFQPVNGALGTNATGAFPVGALVQATSGNIWGVAQGGGLLGQGTIFEVSPDKSGISAVASFGCIEPNCNHDDFPVAGLVQGTDGNFYGTTEEGGTGAFGGGPSGGQFGGSVFKITPGVSGSLTTLYSFCTQSGCTDGQAPMGALVQGADGNFYGTTAYGGTGTACSNGNPNLLGCGTVFEITPSGTVTTLYSFCTQSGCPDGQNPIAGLIEGSDGNFYGTTYDGGIAPSAHCSDNPCGTIFEITPGGTPTTLYSFCVKGEECTSGGGPVAPLVQATNGDFYGTTTEAGSVSSNNGTVFRLSLPVPLGPFVKTLPTSGLVGAAVKILGINLTGATGVTFNGTAAAFTVVSNSEITTTVPAGATIGFVTVTTPSGTLTSNQQFLVIEAALSPATTTFATEPVGTASPAIAITLTNLSASTITSISPSIGGPSASDFSFAAGGTCGTSLAASSSCTYLVTFTPSLVGAGAAALSVTDSVGTQTAVLKGTGIGAALRPATTTFATEPDGTASPAKTITLFTYTAYAISITIPGAIGGTDAADFSITGGTCVGLSSLAAGSSCTYIVTFTPSLVGAETATLSVTDSVGTQTAALKGTGTP